MSRALKDTGVCLLIILASALIYWDSLGLRAGTYDPLGSGTMPRIVAVAIVVLSLIAIAQSFLVPIGAIADPLEGEAEDFERRPGLAVVIFLYLVACAVLLHLQLPFGVSSSLFLFVSALTIKRFERAVVLPAAACSLLFGFGLTYLFGSVFGVDLP